MRNRANRKIGAVRDSRMMNTIRSYRPVSSFCINIETLRGKSRDCKLNNHTNNSYISMKGDLEGIYAILGLFSHKFHREKDIFTVSIV